MIGTTLGHYRVLEKLGAGGMGEVYRAHDLELDRTVALKFIREDLLGDPEMLRRFQHEARALAALDHPHVGTVHGFEETGGRHFMVLAYVEGRPLDAILREGPLPPARAALLLPRIAEGLAAAHARGVVHRDIKSSNILVGDDDVPKLVDFGLAVRAQDTQLTATGQGTVGTIAFMAPEVVRGGRADERSDQFSLGVVLYEALTGQLPFARESAAATLHAILHDEPPPFDARVAQQSRALQPVVRRCLQKDPARRFASVADVAAALRQEHPTVGWTRPFPSRAARPPWWRNAAIGAGLVALAAASLLWLRPGAPRAPANPRAVAVLAFENLTGDRGLDWMGPGLAELLATALSRAEDLDVYDAQRLANLAPAGAGGGPGAFEALRRNGVGRAVVGSVVRSGGRLRIQGRVIDVGTGRVLHSEWVDGDVGGDLFQLAGGLIKGIESSLEVELLGMKTGDAWLREITTSSADAYRLFLQGREAFLASRWAEAAGYYERTLALDSTFVAARVDLTGCYWNLGDDARTQASLAAAARLRDRASRREGLQLDLIAAVVSGDPDRLVRAAGELRGLYPENRFFTYLQGRGYYTSKRYAECLAVLEPLVRARYEWAWTYVLAGRAQAALGHPDEAARCFETGLEVTHGNPELAYVYATFAESRADTLRARALLARAERSPALPQTPEYEALIRLAMARLDERDRRPDSARAEYARALAVASPGSDPAREARAGLARVGAR